MSTITALREELVFASHRQTVLGNGKGGRKRAAGGALAIPAMAIETEDRFSLEAVPKRTTKATTGAIGLHSWSLLVARGYKCEVTSYQPAELHRRIKRPNCAALELRTKDNIQVRKPLFCSWALFLHALLRTVKEIV